MPAKTNATAAAHEPEAGTLVRKLDTSPRAVAEYQRVLGYVQDGLRKDAVLTRMDCPPRVYDDAIRYRDLMQINAAVRQDDSWQMPNLLELHQKKSPELKAAASFKFRSGHQDRERDVDIFERGEKARLAQQRKEAVQQRATETESKSAKKERNSRQNTALLKAIKRTASEIRPAYAPEMNVDVQAASEIEIETARSLIQTVVHNAKLEFKATDEEIQTEDEKDFRARAYRLAILLVLNHQGVRPELAADAIGRTELGAKKLFVSAKDEVHDIHRPTYYYTQQLATRLGIRFARMLEKLK